VVAPGYKHEIIGIRPGEKLHEEMITETDALNSLEFKKHYVILPSMQLRNVNRYMETFEGRSCRPGFRYSSDTNTEWLAVKDLRRLIRSHVDKNYAIPEEDPDEAAVIGRSNRRRLAPIIGYRAVPFFRTRRMHFAVRSTIRTAPA